jgi:hypothetical protein
VAKEDPTAEEKGEGAEDSGQGAKAAAQEAVEVVDVDGWRRRNVGDWGGGLASGESTVACAMGWRLQGFVYYI